MSQQDDEPDLVETALAIEDSPVVKHAVQKLKASGEPALAAMLLGTVSGVRYLLSLAKKNLAGQEEKIKQIEADADACKKELQAYKTSEYFQLIERMLEAAEREQRTLIDQVESLKSQVEILRAGFQPEGFGSFPIAEIIKLKAEVNALKSMSFSEVETELREENDQLKQESEDLAAQLDGALITTKEQAQEVSELKNYREKIRAVSTTSGVQNILKLQYAPEAVADILISEQEKTKEIARLEYELERLHDEHRRGLFITRVLSLAAAHDVNDWLIWNEALEILVNCRDLFLWGTADSEELTEETLPEFEQALTDAAETYRGPDLYCARRRKMRPQGACYKNIPKNLWPLFDACGPVRDVGIGNPLPPISNTDEQES